MQQRFLMTVDVTTDTNDKVINGLAKCQENDKSPNKSFSCEVLLL